MSLPLSPKHGTNPSLEACYICGNETGAILLRGRLPGDAEAPRHSTSLGARCDACKSMLREYVVLMECESEDGPFTGRLVWIRRTALPKVIPDGPARDTLLARGMGLMAPDAFAKLEGIAARTRYW